MGKNESILMAEIDKTLQLAEETHGFYQLVCKNELAKLGKSRATAMIMAQILENYYTCMETLFFRISQYFENSLQPAKWHSDLLDKMTLHISGIRPLVLSRETHANLRELMRFRHFKRYYFELDYDWKKLDYLLSCMEEAAKTIPAELHAFKAFLNRI